MKQAICGTFSPVPQKMCRGLFLKKGLQYNRNGIIDFEITVTVEQLQKLALYIADSYLKAIEG